MDYTLCLYGSRAESENFMKNYNRWLAAGYRMSNLWKTITGDQLTSEVGEWRHIKAGEFIAPGCYSTGTLQGGVV